MKPIRVRGVNRLWWVIAVAVLSLAFGQLSAHATRGPLPWLWLVLNVAIMILTFYGSTRVFRGSDETDAPRPAWRMSARPRASFWMFLWMSVMALGLIGDFVPAQLRTDGRRSGLGTGGELVLMVLDALVTLALAVLYFRSWRRLRAMYPSAERATAEPAEPAES
jgi:hypothetical protein